MTLYTGNLPSFTVAVGRKNKFVTSVDVKIIMRMVVKIIVFIALLLLLFLIKGTKIFMYGVKNYVNFYLSNDSYILYVWDT